MSVSLLFFQMSFISPPGLIFRNHTVFRIRRILSDGFGSYGMDNRHGKKKKNQKKILTKVFVLAKMYKKGIQKYLLYLLKKIIVVFR